MNKLTSRSGQPDVIANVPSCPAVAVRADRTHWRKYCTQWKNVPPCCRATVPLLSFDRYRVTQPPKPLPFRGLVTQSLLRAAAHSGWKQKCDTHGDDAWF